MSSKWSGPGEGYGQKPSEHPKTFQRLWPFHPQRPQRLVFDLAFPCWSDSFDSDKQQVWRSGSPDPGGWSTCSKLVMSHTQQLDVDRQLHIFKKPCQVHKNVHMYTLHSFKPADFSCAIHGNWLCPFWQSLLLHWSGCRIASEVPIETKEALEALEQKNQENNLFDSTWVLKGKKTTIRTIFPRFFLQASSAQKCLFTLDVWEVDRIVKGLFVSILTNVSNIHGADIGMIWNVVDLPTPLSYPFESSAQNISKYFMFWGVSQTLCNRVVRIRFQNPLSH